MREIEQEKLEEILQNHKLWLETRDFDEIKGERADLQGADLRGANLQGANLQEANLYVANLRRADLRGADLRGATLQGADLCVANLQGADLQGANLRVADLQGANLQEANLQEADLDFASLPLRCGGLKWKLDKRLMVQFLYHFCSHECEDKEIKEAQNYLLPLANQFHRVGYDCQKLEPKEILKDYRIG